MQDKESNLPEDWFNKGDDDKQADAGKIYEGISSVKRVEAQANP